MLETDVNWLIGQNSSGNACATNSESLGGYPVFSEERAELIIEKVLAEVGWEGLYFKPEALEDYLEGYLTDKGLYKKTKDQVFSMVERAKKFMKDTQS